ncbi:MAG: hypothetical protein ACKOFA_05585 [Rhodoluna sp.]
MTVAIWVIIITFFSSGVLHLVNPSAFMWLMPPWLPEPIFLIYLSGVFELVAALGLILKKKWFGWFAAAVLLGIWPANIWYAFSVLDSGNAGLITAAWFRLPLQIPLIYFAIKFAQTHKSISRESSR